MNAIGMRFLAAAACPAVLTPGMPPFGKAYIPGDIALTRETDWKSVSRGMYKLQGTDFQSVSRVKANTPRVPRLPPANKKNFCPQGLSLKSFLPHYIMKRGSTSIAV